MLSNQTPCYKSKRIWISLKDLVSYFGATLSSMFFRQRLGHVIVTSIANNVSQCTHNPLEPRWTTYFTVTSHMILIITRTHICKPNPSIQIRKLPSVPSTGYWFSIWYPDSHIGRRVVTIWRYFIIKQKIHIQQAYNAQCTLHRTITRERQFERCYMCMQLLQRQSNFTDKMNMLYLITMHIRSFWQML